MPCRCGRWAENTNGGAGEFVCNGCRLSRVYAELAAERAAHQATKAQLAALLASAEVG